MCLPTVKLGFDASPETPGPRLGTMDYAVDARKSGAVQRLPIASRPSESRLGRIGPISRGTKRTGERSASKSHATFDAAGAGCRISSDWTPLISSEWDHPISG